MTTIWNPQLVLDVGLDSGTYKCRGTTQKGNRCRNSVNRVDRMRAARKLNILARHRPESTAVQDDLQQIAELCLCIRFHRATQVDDIVTEWRHSIARYFPRQHRESLLDAVTVSRAESTLSRHARSSAPSPETVTQVSATSSTSSISSTSQTSEVSIESRPNALPSQHSRRSSTITSPLEDVPNSIGSPATPHIHHTHEVMRRPITEACAICYEEIHTLEDAVWCRAECGQNIHRECWDFWRAAWISERSDSDADEEEQPSCVFCRTPWVEDETTSSPEPAPSLFGTSGLPHEHNSHEVTRRPITEDCVICFDAIEGLDDAVWCRGQCGQNVHGRCWDRWSREQRSNMRTTGTNVENPPACVFCRAPWVE